VLSALTKNKVQSTKYKDPRPQAKDHLLIPHRDLSLKSDRFLIVWIDPDRAQRILPRLTPVAAIEKDPAQQDVRVNQFWIPEDRRLECRDRRLLIAATKIDAATQQIRLGVSRLDPIAFLGATVFLLGVAVAASLLPTREALRFDPVTILRYE